MGTGVEVVGTGSDEIVATSSDDDWVFSDSWDRAVDERGNMNVKEVISHTGCQKQLGAGSYHIQINPLMSYTYLHHYTCNQHK